MILTFVIIFVVGMVWDAGRVNRLLGRTITPGEEAEVAPLGRPGAR